MENVIEISKTSQDFSKIINQIKFPFKTFEFDRICCIVLSVYDLIWFSNGIL